MPEISRFLGMVIAMYYNDHPPAHFHAKYGEYEVTVNIHDTEFNGLFPRRALRLVLEWRDLHREELMENWTLVQQRRPLNRIEPLE